MEKVFNAKLSEVAVFSLLIKPWTGFIYNRIIRDSKLSKDSIMSGRHTGLKMTLPTKDES